MINNIDDLTPDADHLQGMIDCLREDLKRAQVHLADAQRGNARLARENKQLIEYLANEDTDAEQVLDLATLRKIQKRAKECAMRKAFKNGDQGGIIKLQ